MGSRQVKLRDDIADELEKREGKSFSDKVEILLKDNIKPTDSKDIDYNKVKEIVESALLEFKEGRL